MSHGFTSLPADQLTPSQLEALCRGHWTLEDRLHWVRDVAFREDRCTLRSGHAPEALARLRSAVRWLRTKAGSPGIPDGQRHYQSHPQA